MSDPGSQQQPPTRRERQRQATYGEIVEVSRSLLRKSETLSLRAVAAEMGMTAPALYRYVASYQQLQLLVAQAILEDVIADLDAGRARYLDADPAAQLLAAAVGFRRWGRNNPEEFSLIFANLAGPETHQDPSDPGSGPARFDEFFGQIFVRTWERYRFEVPAEEDLAPEVLRAVHGEGAAPLPCVFPEYPPGLSWMFIRCWVRLYGTVTLEVFGHMDAEIIASGALFLAMLEDNARDLGFGDDWPRLRALAAEEILGSTL